GVFCSLDFFLFYVFWEVMLLPMYFLIGVWGGPRREYAAIKFFLYTLAGSVLMLIVMIALYFNTTDADGNHTFNMVTMMQNRGAYTGDWWKLAFIGLFIGFAIKVPTFPFHTWLPDAHVEAPTPISVILAAVLLKMGTYGMLRICFPILPEATRWFAPALMIIGVIGILWGAMCAMAQIRGVPRVDPRTGEKFVERDLKKLIAYSSVSHMGFCLIGMAACTPAGLSGAVFQMWNHGCITGMLFLLVGVIYDRAHHRDIQGFGGIWTVMPHYGVVTALAFMASLGLPGLAGFVSEVLCFVGAFQGGSADAVAPSFWYSATFFKVFTGISVLGVVLGAGYFLWSYERIFLGPLNRKYESLKDCTLRERFTLWPLAIIVVVLGILPFIYLDFVGPHLRELCRIVAMPWVNLQ
ncbi:MAG: complex I subunit 4 family protein, partial [Planctomycetota bacterium]